MNEVFKSLVGNITDRCPRLTDFNVGSALRTLCEAIALQLDEYYYSLHQHTKAAIEDSVYAAFNFERTPQRSASGSVTVTFNSPLQNELLFPTGTQFCTDAAHGYMYYETNEEVYAPVGSTTLDLTVVCVEPGPIGNVPAGTIVTAVTSNSAISSVTNQSAFSNGTNEETNAERQARFHKYLSSLSKGTEAAIIYGALEVEGITGAYVQSGVGWVKVICHDSSGNLSSELREQVISNLENYRAAGIEVQVVGATQKTVNVAAVVLIPDTESTAYYQPLFQQLVTDKLSSMAVGESFYFADLVTLLKSTYPDIVLQVIRDNNVSTSGSASEGVILKPGVVHMRVFTESGWDQSTGGII